MADPFGDYDVAQLLLRRRCSLEPLLSWTCASLSKVISHHRRAVRKRSAGRRQLCFDPHSSRRLTRRTRMSSQSMGHRIRRVRASNSRDNCGFPNGHLPRRVGGETVAATGITFKEKRRTRTWLHAACQLRGQRALHCSGWRSSTSLTSALVDLGWRRSRRG